jgi:hypothetical protein
MLWYLAQSVTNPFFRHKNGIVLGLVIHSADLAEKRLEDLDLITRVSSSVEG